MNDNYRTVRFIIAITLFIASATMTVQAAPENAPQVPASISGLYYQLGGGRYLPPPGAGATTFNISARFKVGLGYSCGQFNYQDNISQMVDQLMTQIRQLPGQLTTAASAAVAGLPGYLIQKANPTLYNIITKTLDETANLFQLSYKSCVGMEREMQRNPGVNPYQGFMKASIADTWTIGAESGELAPDVQESINSSTSREPIRWLGDELYGTAANPIQINRDIVVAGYNIMIGRTADVSVITAPVPGSAMASEPIVQIWPSPAAAGTWVQEVLGDNIIVLDNVAGEEPETIAGKGLRPKVEALEGLIYTALKTALDSDDYQALNQYSSLRVSAAIVESLRSMPAGEAAVLTDRLVSELAVSEARERMMLIKQMIMTGLQAPDLIASTGGSTAKEYIRLNTFRDMDRVIKEIFDALALKQKTINRTTMAIINHVSEKQKTTAGRSTSTPDTGPNALDGAVNQ